MFKFLKDKLKQAVSSFSKKAEEEGEIEEQPETEKTEELPEEKTVKAEAPEKKKKKKEEEKEKPKEQVAKKEKKEKPAKEEKELPITKKEQEKEEQEKATPAPIPEKKEEKPKSKVDTEEAKTVIEEKKTSEEKPEEIQKAPDKDKEKPAPATEEQAEKQEQTTREDEGEETSEAEKLEDSKAASEEEQAEEESTPEEKQGFFSRLGGMFKRKEEVEEKVAELKRQDQEIEAIEKDIEEQDKTIAEIEKKDGIITPKEAASEEIKKEEEKEQETDKEKEPEKQDDSASEEKKDSAESIESTIHEETSKTLEEIKQEKATEKETTAEQPKEEETGFFSRIKKTFTTTKITQSQFEELFWDIEMALLENSVAVEVIEKIKSDLSQSIVDQPLPRKEVANKVSTEMMKSIEGLFNQPRIDIIEQIKQKQQKPYIICFVGVNGSGKTTTIAKVAHMLKNKGLEPVLAASDTFRAAAIDQLELHANTVGVKLIKHDYNADPAAVAFDAIKHAEAKGKPVVLIDTAGRLHSNANLMEELHKIVKVAKPDLTVFIGEAITGNDCIEQAREFNKMVQIDGIILSKADIDEKGGAAISVSYVLGKPIIYLGIGQNYEDLRQFSPKYVLEQLA